MMVENPASDLEQRLTERESGDQLDLLARIAAYAAELEEKDQYARIIVEVHPNGLLLRIKRGYHDTRRVLSYVDLRSARFPTTIAISELHRMLEELRVWQ